MPAPRREVVPRHHTARNPHRDTLGPEVAELAEKLGRTPMPWQREMWDVICEIDPATGLFWYTDGVCTVQRQAGKTDAFGTLATHRCLSVPAARAWLTQQQGKDASTWMREAWHEAMPSAWTARGHVEKSLRAGSEGIYFPATRSRFQVFAPKKDAMHGKQSDLTIVDEAWAHDAEKGLELDQAIDPTQATRPGAQTIIASTMGDDGSEYLEGKYEAAKEALLDPSSRTFLVDYGIPEDADPEDLDVIAAWHPAIGHTIDHAFIVGARQRFRTKVNGIWVDDAAGFARAYGNRPTRTRVAAFAPGRWEAAGTELRDRPERVGYGFDVTPSGDAATVVAAWRESNGTGYVEVLYAGDVKGAATELVRLAKLRVELAYDPAGVETLALADTVRRRHKHAKLKGLGVLEVAAACAAFAAGVIAGTVAHFRQADLTEAADGAATRPYRDGGWLWARKDSRANISPLVAATIALRQADELKPARAPYKARATTTSTRRGAA